MAEAKSTRVVDIIASGQLDSTTKTRQYVKDANGWSGVSSLKGSDLRTYALMVAYIRAAGNDEALSMSRVEAAFAETCPDLSITDVTTMAGDLTPMAPAPATKKAPAKAKSKAKAKVEKENANPYILKKGQVEILCAGIIDMSKSVEEIDCDMLVDTLKMNPKCKHGSFWKLYENKATGNMSGRAVARLLHAAGWQGAIRRDVKEGKFYLKLTKTDAKPAEPPAKATKKQVVAAQKTKKTTAKRRSSKSTHRKSGRK